MRRIALLACAALLFGATPFVNRLGVVAGSIFFLALTVLLAFAVSGGPSALAAMSGAMGAFASGVLSPASPVTGGAVLVALVYAERTTRIRGKNERLVHIGIALLAGALAGALAVAYDGSAITVRLVALVVSAVLVSLPQLIDADDRTAHALDAIASQVDDPARASLREGAELRRHADDALLDRATSRIAQRTWRSLLRLAEARLRLERMRAKTPIRVTNGAPPSPSVAVSAMVDARIAEHVAALARAYTASDAAHAAELGLDDVDLRSAENVGESLDALSRAMIDVQP